MSFSVPGAPAANQLSSLASAAPRQPPRQPSFTDWHLPCLLLRGCWASPAGEQPVVQIHLVHFPLPYLFALPCPCLEPLGLALVVALWWSVCLLMERANSALLASLTKGVWGISQMSLEHKQSSAHFCCQGCLLHLVFAGLLWSRWCCALWRRIGAELSFQKKALHRTGFTHPGLFQAAVVLPTRWARTCPTTNRHLTLLQRR